MPPIPPAGGIMGGFFSGRSVMAHSVVNRRLATEAAFCNAERVTFAGSMIPAATMSSLQRQSQHPSFRALLYLQ